VLTVWVITDLQIGNSTFLGASETKSGCRLRLMYLSWAHRDGYRPSSNSAGLGRGRVGPVR
jgi:hypothetical protein